MQQQPRCCQTGAGWLACMHTRCAFTAALCLQDKPSGGERSLSILNAAPSFADSEQSLPGPSQRSRAASTSDAEEGGSFGPGKVWEAPCSLPTANLIGCHDSNRASRCCWAAAQLFWRRSLRQPLSAILRRDPNQRPSVRCCAAWAAACVSDGSHTCMRPPVEGCYSSASAGTEAWRGGAARHAESGGGP